MQHVLCVKRKASASDVIVLGNVSLLEETCVRMDKVKSHWYLIKGRSLETRGCRSLVEVEGTAARKGSSFLATTHQSG